MAITRHLVDLTFVVVLLLPASAMANSDLITQPSPYSVLETVERYESALRSEGFLIFTELDHSTAAARYGIELRPRIVVVFGRPNTGTANLKQAPTLAIDAPFKALIWQDEDRKVWLTYNSADYVAKHIFPRHGLNMSEDGRKNLRHALEEASRKALQ